MKPFTRLAAILCVLPAAFATGTAAAQAWPSHAITLVVPFAPGGTTDIIARPLGQKLSEAFGQPVLIENRAGAGGTVGAASVARAAPDGYTIFMATVAHPIATSLYKGKLSYDFERDFAPITVVASVPNLVIVNPTLPVKTQAELIAYLKANPGKVSYGSAGIGSIEHLSGELFRSMTGTEMTHIPYKGGAPMMTDLLGGQIQMAIETSGSAAPHVRAGKVRALSVTTAARSPAFPDLPTVEEAGLKGYVVTTWYGLLVPKATPPEIVAKLQAQVAAILKTPDMKARFDGIGAEAGGMPSAQFAAFIRSETVQWAKVVKESGATAESAGKTEFNHCHRVFHYCHCHRVFHRCGVIL